MYTIDRGFAFANVHPTAKKMASRIGWPNRSEDRESYDELYRIYGPKASKKSLRLNLVICIWPLERIN